MAEDMGSSVCSGSWWAPARTKSGYGVSPCAVVNGAADMSAYSWNSEITARSVGEDSIDNHSSSVSGGGVVAFTEVSNKAETGAILMEWSSLHLAGLGLSPVQDWNQNILTRDGGRNTESGLQMVLPKEDLNTSFRQDPTLDSCNYSKDWATKTFLHSREDDDHNLNALKQLHQHHNSHGLEQNLDSGDCSDTSRGLLGTTCSPNDFSQLGLHGFMDQETQLFNMPSVNYRLNSQPLLMDDQFSSSWSKFPQFLKTASSSSSSSPPKQQQLNNQLHFSNNTPFWNASATIGATPDINRSSLFSASTPQFLTQTFEEKPNNLHANITNKRNSTDANTFESLKKSTSEPSFKRPRIETPPLATFKVRKEKMSDRITALQQLVSPFGKTDTASVLGEAIQYIKFLHDQVNALSNPYMKSGAPIHHQHSHQSSSCNSKSKDGSGDHEASAGPKQELRSRGLCLVPISSTFHVTNESAADFWAPTFNYR